MLAQAVRKQWPTKVSLQYCGRIGHIKRYCREFARAEQRAEQKANLSRRNIKQAGVKQRDATSLDSESDALVVNHALSASTK